MNRGNSCNWRHVKKLHSVDLLITFFPSSFFALQNLSSLYFGLSKWISIYFFLSFFQNHFPPLFKISKLTYQVLNLFNCLVGRQGGMWAFLSRGKRQQKLIFQNSPLVPSQTYKDHCWSKSTTPRHSLRCTKLPMPKGFVKMSLSYCLEL